MEYLILKSVQANRDIEEEVKQGADVQVNHVVGVCFKFF